MKASSKKNRYSAIIERIFSLKYVKGAKKIEFEREDIERASKALMINTPKNLGDLIYSFRYRANLPEVIRSKAGQGETWIIRPAGRSKYSLELIQDKPIRPNELISVTKIPDSTPGIVDKYALTDEQALLAKLRYNRLIDIFLGITCHLRTTVASIGQIETDEIYVAVDKRGINYVVPVQAKGGKDKLSIVQIEQDLALCISKFPALVCRPIAAQFMAGGVIALFEFEENSGSVRISSEKHYKLVTPQELTASDLEAYRKVSP